MRPRTFTLILAASLAAPAPAQSGTVRVLADNQPSITIAPGTPIHLMLIAESPIPGLQLAGMKGDLRITDDAGTPSNFVFPLGEGPLVNLGSFVGGSRVGMDLASGPPLFFGINPPWAASPVHILSYVLTLDTPGTYSAVWIPHISRPDVQWYGLPVGPLYAPTEYIPATITVTPTPASLALLTLAPLAPRRRR